MTIRKSLDSAVARHFLTHPEDSMYAAAKHLRTTPKSVAGARRRVQEIAGGLSEAALLRYLRRFPVAQSERHFALPHPDRWLARPPVPVSLSGEDAAAVEGFDLVPRRHLVYVAPEDLSLVEQSLRAAGAEPASAKDAVLSVRVRDPWLADEPGAPLVERGQRLADYAASRHPTLVGVFQFGA